MGRAVAGAGTSGRLILAGIISLCGAPLAQAGLIEYVQKPDPAYTWKLNEKKYVADGVVFDLHLVSQIWQGIQWEHQLQVYQPREVAPNATMLLWNTGGAAGKGDQALAMMLAKKIKAPCAFLYNIPNQPLFGGKKEDALIAETFVRFLGTRDESWPLLFPMVKSVVRAMDALQAFSEREWQTKLNQFVVSGASKRGWTTWLTAAADPRVKAICPMVIDTLNMHRQNAHQKESYGSYSKEIDDYTQRGLVPMPNTTEAKKLWSMVDPYFYRDKLTCPKLIVNGGNDPYWTLDALNLYWDGLKGDKWVLYVPNAGHNLQQKNALGVPDVSRALNALAAFCRAQITGQPMPRITWTHEGDGTALRLLVNATPAPLGARLWVVNAPTRDFRQSKWVEEPLRVAGGKVDAEVGAPAKGCRAFYAELDFTIDGIPFHLSTQVRVVGKPAPPEK